MTDALTILVVDDSAAIRTILCAILEAAGHDVMLAEGVDIGLEMLGLRRPDLVLTDYRMPGRTGRDLVMALRAEGFDRPIFVVSSERDPDIRAAMAGAGADAWFPKPVCAATLVEAVRGVATERRPTLRRPARVPAIGFG
jgi:two-component system chemotaxis response regulator CheY